MKCFTDYIQHHLIQKAAQFEGAWETAHLSTGVQTKDVFDDAVELRPLLVLPEELQHLPRIESFILRVPQARTENQSIQQ